MKRLFAAACAPVLCVSLCSALGTPESVRSMGAGGFEQASLLLPPALKASRHVRLDGVVRLSGSGFVPQSNYATVSVSGTVDARGEGGYGTGYTTVTQSVSVWVNGDFVSQSVRVNAYVSVYKDGRCVGSTYLNGSVMVSGFKNGDWIHLNGTGTLTGDLFVQE